MDISFIPPPEAPVFEPTPEEFEDPIAYISSIRPHAEKFGICKIKPPPHWQPPFAANAEDFKFVPRIQRLNELEAKSRIRLYFLNDLAKFWELQNNSLKKQTIENKTLDLYHLRKFVQERDGYHKVSKNGKWVEVATLLGYKSSNEIVNQLQKIYEKTLLPYDMVVSGSSQKEQANKTTKMQVRSDMKMQIKKLDIITPPLSCDDDKSMDNSMIKSLDTSLEKSKDRSSNQPTSMNSELRKLQFIGAGPRMAVVNMNELNTAASKRTRPRSKGGKLSNLSGKLCEVCGGDEGELGTLISCSSCPGFYHHACSIIGPKDGSKKPWRCHNCVAKECKKPMPSFGFEESKIEYSLKTFGKMADEFKANHFKIPCHRVPCATVEKEFWHLVNSLDSDIAVEYGADIHTLTCGSGFPTERSRHLLSEEEQEYIHSSWNLNNLPTLPRSLLRYINVEINGMKVPWVYVGMCFSSFAWHIEDHWNYSINYLHWGEPKTWYGVPGENAELLEECMKRNASELFEEFPDLLHHITTIMNPNVLMDSGVPIFRTDQHAGEFVVTFPRSYHSGFNQGYNFAEAVNFCTSDWLPYGHDCIENYRQLKRQCVFSNDEFVCKILEEEAGDLTPECVESLTSVAGKILKREEGFWKKMKEKNISKFVAKEFESMQDDERQCDCCQTTCFLSAVTCSCSSSKMVCPIHLDDLCTCPSSEKTFLYRYSVDELKEMVRKVSKQQQSEEQSEEKKIVKQLDEKKIVKQLEEKKIVKQVEETKIVKQLEDKKIVKQFQEKKVLKQLEEKKVLKQFQEKKIIKQLEDKKIVKQLEDKKIVKQFDEKKVLKQLEEKKVVKHFAEKKISLEESPKNDEEEESLDQSDGEENFEAWCVKAEKALHAKGRFKIKFDTMKGILNQAIERKYPSVPLVEALKSFCKKTERCFHVIHKITSPKSKRNDDDNNEERPTFEELLRILDEIDKMPCKVPFASKYVFVEQVTAIQEYCEEIRNEVEKDPLDSDSIDLLFEKASKFNVDIPDIALLHQAMSKISWLQEVCEMESETVQVSLDTVQRLYETGQKLTFCHTAGNKLDLLNRLIANCKRLESAVALSLAIPTMELQDFESLLDECLKSKVVIPSSSTLEAAIKDSSEWNLLAKDLFKDHIELDCEDKYRPYLEDIEAHMNLGRQIPIHLPQSSIMAAKVCCAKSWVNRLSELVLKSDQDSLIDMLTPRRDVQLLLDERNESKNFMDYKTMESDRNPKEYDFDLEREKELSDMKKLRSTNLQKVASAKKNSFCICYKGKSGRMVQCQLCFDLFHVGCVNYSTYSKNTKVDQYDGFLCPMCARTNRASYTALQVYLNQYENDFDLRITEGDILKELMRRAEIWRENVGQVFKGLDILRILKAWELGKNLKDLLRSEEFANSTVETLEELLISGNLMEVSMPEKNLIRHIISGTKANYRSLFIEYPNVLPDVVKMCCPKRPRKRSVEIQVKIEEPHEPPTRKVRRSNESSPRRSRKVDNEDRCSAEPCQDPEGDNLEWVQCDFCRKWFHFLCIGLEKIKKKEKFQCRNCSALFRPIIPPLMTKAYPTKKGKRPSTGTKDQHHFEVYRSLTSSTSRSSTKDTSPYGYGSHLPTRSDVMDTSDSCLLMMEVSSEINDADESIQIIEMETFEDVEVREEEVVCDSFRSSTDVTPASESFASSTLGQSSRDDVIVIDDD